MKIRVSFISNSSSSSFIIPNELGTSELPSDVKIYKIRDVLELIDGIMLGRRELISQLPSFMHYLGVPDNLEFYLDRLQGINPEYFISEAISNEIWVNLPILENC